MTYQTLQEHRRTHEPTTGFLFHESAFRRNCLTFRKVYDRKACTFEQAAQLDRTDLLQLLSYHVLLSRSIKCTFASTVEFLKMDPEGGVTDIYEMTLKCQCKFCITTLKCEDAYR